MGHLVERAIAEGRVKDYEDAARRFGVTKARISQVAALALRAPDIQERIIEKTVAAGARATREAARHADWGQQARALAVKERGHRSAIVNVRRDRR